MLGLFLLVLKPPHCNGVKLIVNRTVYIVIVLKSTQVCLKEISIWCSMILLHAGEKQQFLKGPLTAFSRTEVKVTSSKSSKIVDH